MDPDELYSSLKLVLQQVRVGDVHTSKVTIEWVLVVSVVLARHTLQMSPLRNLQGCRNETVTVWMSVLLSETELISDFISQMQPFYLGLEKNLVLGLFLVQRLNTKVRPKSTRKTLHTYLIIRQNLQWSNDEEHHVKCMWNWWITNCDENLNMTFIY